MHVDVTLHSDADAGPNPLITVRGHTLTVDEAHALVLGVTGLLYGLSTSAAQSLDREPHYFLASLAATYLVGRELRHVRTQPTDAE